eukprot:12481482-Alexandrium_andersonii.AAC.1
MLEAEYAQEQRRQQLGALELANASTQQHLLRRPVRAASCSVLRAPQRGLFLAVSCVPPRGDRFLPVSYTHLRAHETSAHL